MLVTSIKTKASVAVNDVNLRIFTLIFS
jgi:hypothetical protein